MQERSMCDQALHKLSKVQNEALRSGQVKSAGIAAVAADFYRQQSINSELDQAIKLVNHDILEVKRKQTGTAVGMGDC
jgi:hypothetical protein